MLRPSRQALVTGANRGIGRAVCAALHARGYRVIVTARRTGDAQDTADAVGPGARGLALDVTDPASVAAARVAAGPVDILVNNAGVLLDFGKAPSAVPLELVESELAVNVLGTWRVSQAFIPGMVERGWGRVVMVSSGTSAFSNGLFPGAPGYALSKTGVNALTVLLARETSGTGVLVNAVNPGLVGTRMRPDAPRSPADAAVEVVWAATLPDDGPTGGFFRAGRRIDW
jgi:NAD(P)-dependent dehydrogenase (short-subunit alcohol dehydrogenase family)